MDEHTLKMLLSTVPTFEFIIRVQNSKGDPCSFGFIRYSSIESLKVVADILSKVDYNTVTKGKFDKLFKVTMDENTRRYIADYEASNGSNFESRITGKSIDDSVAELTSKLKAWYQINEAAVDSTMLGKKEEVDTRELKEVDEDSVVMDEEDFMDVPIEQRDAVFAEIKEFRVLSIKYEKVKIAQNAEETKEREKHLQQVASKALEDKSETKNIREEDESESEEISDDDDPPETDAELEAQRAARREAKAKKLFEETQRRWLGRERLRNSALERERIRDEDQEPRLEQDKKQAIRKLSEFKDNGDYETRTMEYYYDHAKWVKTRMQFREREIEHDNKDAEEEAQELEAKEASKDKFMEDLSGRLPATSVLSSATGKIKLSLGAGSRKLHKKTNEGDKLLDDGGDESLAKPKKSIKPLDYGDGVLAIPDDKDSLFKWSVKWDALSEDIIEDSLKPFITSTIVEYLGVQEDDLIDFVLQHIRDHKAPEELVSELEMALDEDAEIFAKKVWKLLVQETEAAS